MDIGKDLPWLQNYDIILISETHGKTPDIKEFTLAAKYTSKNSSRGGIALYVKHGIAQQVHNIHKHECYISFQLKCVPTFLFIGLYIPPIDSTYFNEDCFPDVISFLIDKINSGLTIFAGGDLNMQPTRRSEQSEHLQ